MNPLDQLQYEFARIESELSRLLRIQFPDQLKYQFFLEFHGRFRQQLQIQIATQLIEDLK